MPAKTANANVRKPVIGLIRGAIRKDAFYFTLQVNGTKVANMILDTGAYEMIFNGRVARKLGLPNLGTTQVQGVGGAVRMTRSACTLRIGNKTYRNVPCLVDQNFPDAGLFGLKFFIDHKLSLTLNPVKRTLAIRPA